ncbi:MAG: imidazole glycerol phosphate synthase subunit HisH [Acidimicrobiales bacterium]
MNRVAIVDYGLCNLDSVRRAVEECGGTATVTSDPADLRVADRIILPGVGSFAAAAANLQRSGLADELTEQVMSLQAPFLGICLGMQLMLTVGVEGSTDGAGETKGLGWIDGRVERLAPTPDDPRIPHVGWNEVHRTEVDAPLLDSIDDGADVYFVHSFHARCSDDRQVIATTPYAGGFVSAVANGNAFGVQFHPEKSQTVGFAILRRFLEI